MYAIELDRRSIIVNLASAMFLQEKLLRPFEWKHDKASYCLQSRTQCSKKTKDDEKTGRYHSRFRESVKEVEAYKKMANSSDGFDYSVFDFTDDDCVKEESFPRVGTVKKGLPIWDGAAA